MSLETKGGRHKEQEKDEYAAHDSQGAPARLLRATSICNSSSAAMKILALVLVRTKCSASRKMHQPGCCLGMWEIPE